MTADAKSRAYGDANPALTYQVGGSGLVNGDSLSGALATSATTTSNVGVYGISQGTLAASGNYALNYTSANLTVGQRAITVTADAKSRAYGDANPALTYQVGGSGLVNGDRLSGALATSATTAEQCRRLRHQPGHARGLGQLRAELYERQPDRRPARDHSDGRCQEPCLWRCQSGADLSGRRLGAGQWRHAVGCAGDVGDDASNVGTYGIGQGTLAASGNYALNYTSDNLTVGQRAITVTADAKSRAYGDANPALTYQVGGSGWSTATRCRVRWRRRRRQPAMSAPTASRRARWRPRATTR